LSEYTLIILPDDIDGVAHTVIITIP
jgi:hypothetical protein